MSETKYFIEDIETNKWFMVRRAFDNDYWTDDPNWAKSFNRTRIC